MNMKALATGFSVVGLFVSATMASAHHGWSWAEDKQTEISGSVTSISFAPPHPSMTADIDGESWQVDLGNPNQTRRSGFSESSVNVGDEITILGNKSLDEAEKLIKAVRITVNGTQFDMYPERIQSE